MKNDKIFKNKMTLDYLIYFFNRYNRLIDFGIIFSVLFFAGLFFYFYALSSIINSNENIGVNQVSFNRNVYGDVLDDFSKRPEKLQEIIGRSYIDPFR